MKNPKTRGSDYAWDKHGPSASQNKSKFSIDKSDLDSLLQSKQVVQSPVRRTQITWEFIREVDVGKTIGNLPQNAGGSPTSILTVVTDRFGNLINTWPVPATY